MNTYKPVIGLEIHVELKTISKMFCQCSADYFGKKPNTNTCPVCLGMPGALPVPNKKAVEWTIKIGKALNCTINTVTKFDRKHYFYPDLPKGYQISQYDVPIAINGHIEINGKQFGITRVHLEEDTGKLQHKGQKTLVDFNRSSVPLVEIVTEPDFNNSDDVKKFLEELRTIIRYLDVSDADMEKGSMRLEPNISIRKPSETDLPKYKVEVKNINSFNYVKKAIEFELVRQQEILEAGALPKQETRGYNEDKGITVSQRSKEEAHDYRYFPEPDIPPMVFEQAYIEAIVTPELPAQKTVRYIKEFGLKEIDAFTLTRDIKSAQYFESACAQITDKSAHKSVANLIINKKLATSLPLNDFVSQAASMLRPKQTDTGALSAAISTVLAANQKAVADYKSGKETVIMYLVGQVLKQMRGQADPTTVKEELALALKPTK